MHDLHEVSKETVIDTFNLPKVCKLTKLTCLKLVKKTIDLLDFDVNPAT